MSEGNGNIRPLKQTLLQKYDLMIDCLSFEHIEKCSNKKELERILKILRSGEEGSYPALEKAAEQKLQKLSPNNHLLRSGDPVIPMSALEPEHRQLVSNDVQMWANEMVERENLLKCSDSMCSDEVPSIRNSTTSKAVSDKNKVNTSTSKATEKCEKTPRKCVPNDYSFWEKFDADNEILKMDLEEERHKEKKEKEIKDQERLKNLRQEQEEKSMRDKMKDASVGAGDSLSGAERSYIAQQERNKGNESFRTKDFAKALYYYTKSIEYEPSVDAYNNRAQTYLKIQKYSEAIEDSQRVLQLDPANVKGLYRRGVGHFSLKKYHDALHDFEKVLEMFPNNEDCQDYAKRTRAQLGISASSKRVRMAIQDTSVSSNKVEEVKNTVEGEDIYYPFFNTSPNEDIVLNEIGTAKVMCRCSGTPGFMKKVRSLEDIKGHGRLCLRRNSKPKKREIPNPKLKQSASNEGNVNKIVKKNDEIAIFDESKKSDATYNEIQGSKEKLTALEAKDQRPQDLHSVANENGCSAIENIKSGYSFTLFWKGLKGTEDLPTVAKFLNGVTPEILKKVVGNKLDVKMLSLFIMALQAHFSLPGEWEVVQRYLHTFTQLPRFACVSMMLEKTTKNQLESLLNEAEGHGLRVSDLLQLYGMTDCPQS